MITETTLVSHVAKPQQGKRNKCGQNEAVQRWQSTAEALSSTALHFKVRMPSDRLTDNDITKYTPQHPNLLFQPVQLEF